MAKEKREYLGVDEEPDQEGEPAQKRTPVGGDKADAIQKIEETARKAREKR